jgi:haloalkane dehalogenase
MEFIRPTPTWKDFHLDAIETLQEFRTPGMGEKMILEDNVFVEESHMKYYMLVFLYE